MIVRRPDWLTAMNDALDEARGRAFDWRDWNCCTFVDHVVHAMTGTHPLGDYAGAFDDEASALAVLAERDGNLRAACRRVFGMCIKASFAKRGDVVMLRGGRAIGICVGGTVLFADDDGTGLVQRPLVACAYAFPLAWPVMDTASG